MADVHIKASAIVPAAAEQVYAVFSDYRVAHNAILPKPPFGDVQVEQGGSGAGTVFRVSSTSWGTTQHYHMDVTEPTPGRVLVETDRGTDLVTTFTITPTADPNQTHVEIVTRYGQKPGVTGWLDRLITPLLAPIIYRKELRNVAAYLQGQQAVAQ